MSTIKKKSNKVLPLISIIMPVYNTEKYLVTCLESIITNTYKNLEIICVDDGSTDNSLNILHHYAKKDSRVKVLKQKQKGPSAARNKGLEIATGDYITFVDSDDFVQWNAYEILSTVVSEHEVDIVMFGANTFGLDNVPNGVKEIIDTHYQYYKNCDGCKVVIDEKAARPFLWLHMIRRELFETLPKIRFSETMELNEEQLIQFQYIPRAQNIMVIEDKLYNYRISRKGSLMQNCSNQVNVKVEKNLSLVQKIIDVWKKEDLYENNEGMLSNFLINFLYDSINELPKKFKQIYAKNIVEMFSKNKVRLYLMAESKMPIYQEIVMWSENVFDDVNKAEHMDEQANMPLISIIMPVYNTEKYLVTCLDSIITNTYKKLEIICIDDGSTDNSLDVLHHYAKKDSRIKVLEQKQKGPSAARNKGLEIATGDYISFVDSDDFVSWNAYEILSKVVNENEIDIVMFGANTFGSADVPNWIREKLDTRYQYYKNCDGCKVVIDEKAARPFLWLHMIRRELFEIAPKIRFDESMELGEDQLVQFQYIPRANNIMVIEDKLYNYRISRSGSLMQMYSTRVNMKAETHLKLAQNIIDAWKKEDLYENNEGMLSTFLVNFLYYSINELPEKSRKMHAKSIVDLFSKNKVRLYLMAEWEIPRYQEIVMWSENDSCDENRIEDLRRIIEQEKYEIEETLKSKAFKVGRFFTGKEKRLNYDEFKEY